MFCYITAGLLGAMLELYIVAVESKCYTANQDHVKADNPYGLHVWNKQ